MHGWAGKEAGAQGRVWRPDMGEAHTTAVWRELRVTVRASPSGDGQSRPRASSVDSARASRASFSSTNSFFMVFSLVGVCPTVGSAGVGQVAVAVVVEGGDVGLDELLHGVSFVLVVGMDRDADAGDLQSSPRALSSQVATSR